MSHSWCPIYVKPLQLLSLSSCMSYKHCAYGRSMNCNALNLKNMPPSNRCIKKLRQHVWWGCVLDIIYFFDCAAFLICMLSCFTSPQWKSRLFFPWLHARRSGLVAQVILKEVVLMHTTIFSLCYLWVDDMVPL